MVKVNLSPRLEDGGFRIQDISDKGYVSGSIDIKQEELPELMEEICNGDEVLLNALRFCYQNLEAKSFIFEDKE